METTETEFKLDESLLEIEENRKAKRSQRIKMSLF